MLLETALSRLFEKPLDDITEHWNAFKEMVNNAALNTLGKVKCKHQDWFDKSNQSVQHLLQTKATAPEAHISHPNSTSKKCAFLSAKSTLQRQLRAIKSQWWEKKAKELQAFANCNNSRSFYEAIKVMYGPLKQSTSQLLSKDAASILTEKSEHLKRWQEHFYESLNRPGTIIAEALGRVHSQSILFKLDAPPTLDKVIKAIKELTPNKAPGPDGIIAEIYQYGGATLTSYMHELFIKL